jgi:hypothetical protein
MTMVTVGIEPAKNVFALHDSAAGDGTVPSLTATTPNRTTLNPINMFPPR